MNDKAPLPSEDDVRFDRLVDGELSHDEYASTLASLDDQPEGWRRCALAFLEAQALGQEFSAVRRGFDLPVSPKTAESFWKTPAPRSLWLAVAATFLVALGLGFVLREVTTQSPDSNLVVQPTVSGVGQRPEARNQLAAEPNFRRAPVGNLSLVVNGEGGSREEQIDLPIFDAADSEAWNSMEGTGLPPDVRRTLERLGHRIELQRELLPFELRDGRQVVVPVEQYRIVPAARRSY